MKFSRLSQGQCHGTRGQGAKGCKKRSCRCGLTLIELLVYISILALLTALIAWQMPPLSRWSLESAARVMAGNIRLLRQEAISTANTQKAVFYIYNDCYSLSLEEGNRCIELPEEIRFKGLTTFPLQDNVPYVHFNRLGRPSSGGTVILQSGSAEKRYVIVTPVTGRVRVSRDPPAHW